MRRLIENKTEACFRGFLESLFQGTGKATIAGVVGLGLMMSLALFGIDVSTSYCSGYFYYRASIIGMGMAPLPGWLLGNWKGAKTDGINQRA
ncbi:MAG: hypothetical protein M2R45_05479 [Verrucomicrobia subdivision 3 bacterium]|nr:hypothetical protein [Limisphaerales bacterium]